jgi:NAD(P)H-dependent FMN reductase
MDHNLKLALIYGSTRAGRFCDKVATWAAQRITNTNKFSLEVLDPAAPPLRAAGNAELDLAWLRKQVAEADGFVVVTPEYNHGYPAALKSLIDSVGSEWQAKPVAFVSYGGISGGLRAVEQLRLVFAELHAVTTRDSVSFANAWEQFDAAGALLQPERPERQMATMLARLEWWAMALRNARSAVPYSQAA